MTTKQKADKAPRNLAALKEELGRYKGLNQKVGILAELGLKKSLARPPAERMAFLQSLEEGRAVHRAELDAMARIVTERLGVPQEEWLHFLNEELANQVGNLQVELGVGGWDKNGNPVVAPRKK